MINLTATFHAKAGKESVLQSLLVAMLEPTRNEPGCLRYDLLIDSSNPAIFMFQEQFTDKQAFEEHCQQAHFLKLLDSLEGLLEQEPTITFYDQL
ncbi:putative quinol monooxygenase [Vibrio neptunius]|uniref:putative quinol monooxygenase n=1 Tax=Vibrio neptunius TaxID=170651 RepID=UPI0019D1BB82|nr:putative quinol monooxygenase [Vibrio neptunius]MBN3573438.1 antibiotic biosynthesis monooxygenase [Vibrio neptunius]QXX07999.1 antibiotic biosynthesis monooxygenase [Vibrio neptunius]